MTGARLRAAVDEQRPPFEVGPIAAGEMWPTARALARAFIDDPIAAAIGPRRRAHRRITSPLSFMGVLIASHRHGGTIRVARDPEGTVLGASISFEPGAWPIPEGAAAYELGWLLIAGPAPVRRGLDFDRRIRAAHVPHPHSYLWFLAVDPVAQSRGVGRALLAELHTESAGFEVPTYLETGKMENVAYYGSSGYEVIGDLKLASGQPMWLMERAPA